MRGYPSDLIARVGQDVGIGDIFRAARQARRLFYWPALSGMLLMGFILIASSMVLGIVVQLLQELAGSNPSLVLLASMAGTVLLLALYIVVTWPLLAGYWWSVVCTFDARPPRVTDLFHGFRVRFGTLSLLGLLETLIQVGVILGVTMALGCIIIGAMGGTVTPGALPTAPSAWLWLSSVPLRLLVIVLVAYGVMLVASMVIRMLFFLAPLLALAQEPARANECLRSNWRMLKARPGPFLLFCFLPHLAVLGAAAVSVPAAVGIDHLLRHGAALPAALLVLALVLAGVCAASWFTVYYVFLSAAFFRAAYGYSLEMPESSPPPGGPASQDSGRAPMPSGSARQPPAQPPTQEPPAPGKTPATGPPANRQPSDPPWPDAD